MTPRISLLILAAILSGGSILCAAPQKNISEKEIKTAINRSSGCDSLARIVIDHLEYFDFTGDGRPEAVVVASTCMTGTAGPDIHAVYTRNAHGQLTQLPVGPHPDQSSQKLPVFGNPNYGLSVEDHALVARWTDSSERENPLIIWYKWNGTRFLVDHMKVEGPFPASYDCAKSTAELDRAICYSQSVAALDVQLAQTYREALQQTPPAAQQNLRDQQRQWLAQRAKQCTIYKWWVDCLTDMYNKRIAELKPHPPS